MKLSEFKHHLKTSPDHELRFVLPDGDSIEPHAHITEVGRVDKKFIDCGGVIRDLAYCSLQAWTADDKEHRLLPGQLAAIIEKASPILKGDDLDVEIEYEDCRITQFPVTAAGTSDNVLSFQLGAKRTACLAQEICLPDAATGSSCC